MRNFDDLGLAEPILRAVTDEGYTTSTPIQNEVIPRMLSGKDLIGIAQTGTGKTASFVLPMLNHVLEEGTKAKPRTCTNLILTPTRELAQQINENIQKYSKFMQASAAVVVGGVKPKPQIKALEKGNDIVVATPGRLLDLMGSGAVSLEHTTCVILDEADQMLDLGFIPAIRQILKAVPKKRQTVLMSATMPPKVRALATSFLTNPDEVSVAAVSRPVERIAQSVRHVPAGEKRATLTEILKTSGEMRTIVFTRTKRGADRVSRHLVANGLTSAAIHGNKSQSQRERALASFRTGETAILVATDIAARGIDIDDVSHVINYELPNVPEAYVHRIGRTARAGRDGTAISLCDPAEVGLLKDIERLIGNKLEGSASDMPEQVPTPSAKKDAKKDGNKGPQRPNRSRKRRPKKNSAPQTANAPKEGSKFKKRKPKKNSGMASLKRKRGNAAKPATSWAP